MILRTCRKCSATHDAGSWFSLRYVGIQADDVESLELRDCVCGNTLAVPIHSRAPVARAGIYAGRVWYQAEETGGNADGK